MACTKCNGCTIELDRILDGQLPVVVAHCLNCGKDEERGHVPVVKEIAPQGRPVRYLGWRGPAKTNEMEQ